MNGTSFLSLFKPAEELAVIFDIGNASIGGSLVLLSRHNHPKVVYTVRKEMNMQTSANITRMVSYLEATLNAVVDDIRKNGIVHLTFTRRGMLTPKTAFCFFSAPWYAAHIRRSAFVSKESITVSSRTLEELLEKEVVLAEESQADAYLRAGARENDVTLLEKEIVHIALNGYPQENPFGKKAKDIEALFYISVVPSKISQLVEMVVRRSFDVKNIHFGSFALVFWNGVRDMWPKEKDYLLLDVSGELTELVLVHGGVLTETATFPKGRNFFVRTIMEHLSTSAHEASSLLNLYIEGKAGPGAGEQIGQALRSAEKEWGEDMKGLLSGLSDGLFLPWSLFLTADDPFARWLGDVLKDPTATMGSSFGKPFTIHVLDDHTLSRFTDAPRAAHDNFLFLCSLFAQKIQFPL